MAVIASLGKEEFDKMCQEMSDCIENNTFDEEKIIQAVSNWDLKTIKAANVPESYQEEGRMRDHWQHLSKYLTTLQKQVIEEFKVENEYHQRENLLSDCKSTTTATAVENFKTTSGTTSNDTSARVDTGGVYITLSSDMPSPLEKRAALYRWILSLLPNISPHHLTKKNCASGEN